MSFGRERALYRLIGCKKAQIQNLRDYIKNRIVEHIFLNFSSGLEETLVMRMIAKEKYVLRFDFLI